MKSKIKKEHLKFIWIFVLLAVWELTARFGPVNPISFPSLAVIASALWESVITGDIISQIWFSMGFILTGLLTAIILSLVLASISTFSELMDSFTDTLVSVFHPLPGIAMLPLIILWFGTGSKAIFIIIIHSVIWPMLLNLKSGFKSVPEIYRKIGQNYEHSMAGILFKIFIPASLPFGLAGIKIGWARAWRAVISAEMVFGATGGKGGIGWYIFNKRVFMDTPGLFAGLIVIIGIGILVEDLVIGKIENSTVKKWGTSQ
ncbi:ABC transporter permease [Alkalibacter mobilis]|uniref:ABC transporter permease n=1 Tax=Alkalibacter mobilis TaxID=2787712 RepID=UPI00189D4741|nr:ABC transporter permease subunit [Alkalibacter mobilis]MBF7096229.1 ABC transporter permease subunit [Alkalibacter mobilis]